MRYILTIVTIAILLSLSCVAGDTGTPGPDDETLPETTDNVQVSVIDGDVEDADDDTPFDPTEGLEDGVAEIGEEYFHGENRGRCLVCHSLGDEGFEDGWALDDTGLRRSPDYLARWIDNPRNLRPEVVIMPPWRGDSEGATIADVVAFLMTLQTAIERLETSDIRPDDEPEPNFDGIAGSEGSHGRY